MKAEAARPDGAAPRHGLIGESRALREVRCLIEQYGPSEAVVLISGETGTGKDVVARALHAASRRARGPFVPVNCGAIAVGLFESELFGSARGAYTGADRDRKGLVEAARGGTLFLDEIAEIPPEAQAKLLHLLERGFYRPLGSPRELHADIRVISASNHELDDLAPRGRFRADLYYRLNVLRIHLPPLRERRADILALVHHFLEQFSPEKPLTVAPEALAQLVSWPWPGNVRELKHTVERTVLRGGTGGGTIRRFDLPADTDTSLGVFGRRAVPAERLAELLERHGGRLGPVASQLGVSVRTVQRRMKEIGLRRRDFLSGRRS